MKMLKKFAVLILFSPVLTLFAAGGTAKYSLPMDPVYEDYMQTLGGFTLPPDDYRDALSGADSDFKLIYSGIRKKEDSEEKKKALEDYRKNSPYNKNPLFYKVRFPWETGPLGSPVLPARTEMSGGGEKNFVYLKLSVSERDYPEVMERIRKNGFRLAGEKVFYGKDGKKTQVKELWGWVPYSGFSKIISDRGVMKAAFVRDSGFSSRTKVSFFLKVPYYVGKNVFLYSFVNRMKEKHGFLLEKTEVLNEDLVRLTGEIPFNRLGDLYSSSFVMKLMVY